METVHGDAVPDLPASQTLPILPVSDDIAVAGAPPDSHEQHSAPTEASRKIETEQKSASQGGAAPVENEQHSASTEASSKIEKKASQDRAAPDENERHSAPTEASSKIEMEQKNASQDVAVREETDNQIVEQELMKLVESVEKNVVKTGEKASVISKKGITKGDKVEHHVIQEATITPDEGNIEDDKPDYQVLIQEAKEEFKDLSTENKILQRRLLAIQKRRSTIGTKLFLEGAESQYQISLKLWMDAKEELAAVRNDYDNKIDRMQEIAKEKQQEAHTLHQDFSAFKWQVAREARHVYSGRRLSNLLLDELQAEDLKADLEIERLRIEGRQYASQLKKIQQAILKKDQLSDSLFAVDFEQLKIENESLNEKLLKKNKELGELEKKTTHIVHVISHSREKLHFLQKKIKTDAGLLESLETELTKARTDLQRIKRTCEKLSLRKERIQSTVNIRTLPLLDDMEANRDETEVAENNLKDLKHNYNTLVKHIQKMQQMIREVSPRHSIECQISAPVHDKNLRWGARRKLCIKKQILRR